jgi:hypothetical protein
MGNRAVVTFDNYDPNNFGVYLHWNGGRDSIEAMLEATKRIMETRGEDPTYAMARFVQVATTAIPGNCSIGLNQLKRLDTDNFDNGVYVVDSKTLEIVGRHHHDGPEQNHHNVEEFADILVKAVEASAEVINNA